jgi:8-oxo-dGTP diphosphatase
MLKIVSLIILNCNNELLLLKRSPNRKSYPNKWNFLSGKIENELPIECANRELSEELGNESKFKLLEEGGSYIDIQKEGKWNVFPFIYRFISGNIIVNDEHTEYKWINRENLDSYDIVPGTMEDLKHVFLKSNKI